MKKILWLIGAGLLIAATRAKAQETKYDEIPLTEMTPNEFYKAYLQAALDSEALTKVPHLVTLAQAGLESAYGKAAYGNNFFGIKANSGYTGLTQKLRTWECGTTGNATTDGIKDEIIAIYPPGDPNGVCGKTKYSYRVRALFRAYKTVAEGFRDHGNFLRAQPRYKKAFQYTDPVQFATQIALAGYATDPDYLSKLIAAINRAKNAVAGIV